MKGWRWGLMGAALLWGLGCGSAVEPGTFEQGMRFAEVGPPIAANAPGRGTQSGLFPLGASSKYRNSDVREGRADINLVGALVPPADRMPPSAMPEARGGGEVAFVPGTFTRRGHGITAQNGSNLVRRGDAIVRHLEIQDPYGPQEDARLEQAATPEAPSRPEAVGGSGP